MHFRSCDIPLPGQGPMAGRDFAFLVMSKHIIPAEFQLMLESPGSALSEKFVTRLDLGRQLVNRQSLIAFLHEMPIPAGRHQAETWPSKYKAIPIDDPRRLHTDALHYFADERVPFPEAKALATECGMFDALASLMYTITH